MRVVGDELAPRLAAVVDHQRDQRAERQVAAHDQQEQLGAADHGRERSGEPHQEDQRGGDSGEHRGREEMDRAGATNFSRQLIVITSLHFSRRMRTRAAQALVLLRARLGRRGAARFEARVGLVAWRFLGAISARRTRSSRRASAIAPVLFLAARFARHDEQLAGVGDALAGERAQPRLHVVAQRRVARPARSAAAPPRPPC